MSQNLSQQAKNHIETVLGISVQVSGDERFETIPYRLREEYSLSAVTLLGKRFALLCANHSGEVSPSGLEKHLDWIEGNLGMRAIYSAESMERYNRKRFIERKIPFVIPGNQLYLPDLGIDLREHLKALRTPKKKLGPAAQVITLGFLLKKLDSGPFTATDLARELDYTKMSMSRAIQDLAELGLVEVIPEGKERPATFLGTRREVWKRARKLMKSPVKKRFFLEREPVLDGFLAGVSALSEGTLLAADRRKVIAVTDKRWKEIQTDPSIRLIPEASSDIAELELEIWSYDPSKLCENLIVDPLSLALSFEAIGDERIEQAIEQRLEMIPWLKD